MSKPLLQVSDLDIHYGGLHAVRKLHLCLTDGETVALIGSNGAGKSSTLNAVMGWVKCQGAVMFGGVDLQTQASHQRNAMGLTMVPEGRGIFGRMTIHENLQIGAHTKTDKALIAQDLQRMYDLFPRLAERRTQLAGTLSGGEQQMLAMARALMSRPKLLLLDEPSMGLAPIFVDRIFELIQTIANQGTSVLLVEQNARRALEISNRAYVMETGEITLTGPSAELLHDDRIRQAYLGEA